MSRPPWEMMDILKPAFDHMGPDKYQTVYHLRQMLGDKVKDQTDEEIFERAIAVADEMWLAKQSKFKDEKKKEPPRGQGIRIMGEALRAGAARVQVQMDQPSPAFEKLRPGKGIEIMGEAIRAAKTIDDS